MLPLVFIHSLRASFHILHSSLNYITEKHLCSPFVCCSKHFTLAPCLPIDSEANDAIEKAKGKSGQSH